MATLHEDGEFNLILVKGLPETVLAEAEDMAYEALHLAVFRTAPQPLDCWPIIRLGLFPGFIGEEIDKALRARTGPRPVPTGGHDGGGWLTAELGSRSAISDRCKRLRNVADAGS